MSLLPTAPFFIFGVSISPIIIVFLSGISLCMAGLYFVKVVSFWFLRETLKRKKPEDYNLDVYYKRTELVNVINDVIDNEESKPRVINCKILIAANIVFGLLVFNTYYVIAISQFIIAGGLIYLLPKINKIFSH